RPPAASPRRPGPARRPRRPRPRALPRALHAGADRQRDGRPLPRRARPRLSFLRSRAGCYDGSVSGERGPSVSIVVPCYNEEANLRAGALTHVALYAERADDVAEVLIVDDGSTDASRMMIGALAAKHAKLRLLAEPHRGKAGAVVAGIVAARAEFVLFTDMDQATPIEELEKLRPLLTEGYDVLVGSRSEERRVG